MAVHASLKIGRIIRLAAAFALSAMSAACSSIGDPAGYAIVTQDAFDFKTCPEVVGTRNATAAREKELVGLIEKADSSPGGMIVSYTAYRTELTSMRAQIRAADRAIQMKGCK